jgi:hypothetical protein
VGANLTVANGVKHNDQKVFLTNQKFNLLQRMRTALLGKIDQHDIYTIRCIFYILDVQTAKNNQDEQRNYWVSYHYPKATTKRRERRVECWKAIRNKSLEGCLQHMHTTPTSITTKCMLQDEICTITLEFKQPSPHPSSSSATPSGSAPSSHHHHHQHRSR